MKISKRKQIGMLMALGACLLSGCGGNREASLVGKWKVDAASLNAASSNDAQRRNALRNSYITLQLNADKTYALNRLLQMTGTWEVDDQNTLALTMTKVGGRDIAKILGSKFDRSRLKPMLFGVSSDGSKLTAQDSSGAKSASGLVFVKQ